MSNKIYVGNLPYQTDENELREIFSQFGSIVDVSLIKDRETHKFKGFGFITFTDSNSAKNALAFNGQKIGARVIKVDRAKERAGGSGGSGGSGGFRGQSQNRGWN